MRVTRKQIVDLYVGLSVINDLDDAKFSYSVNKNLSKIKPIMQELEQLHRAYQPFLIYDHKRTQLAKEFAVMKDGVPQTKEENGIVSLVIENEVEFNHQVKKLQEEHKEAILERQEQIEGFKKYLAEEIDFDLYTIPKSFVPESITGNKLQNIQLIIKE